VYQKRVWEKCKGKNGGGSGLAGTHKTKFQARKVSAVGRATLMKSIIKWESGRAQRKEAFNMLRPEEGRPFHKMKGFSQRIKGRIKDGRGLRQWVRDAIVGRGTCIHRILRSKTRPQWKQQSFDCADRGRGGTDIYWSLVKRKAAKKKPARVLTS